MAYTRPPNGKAERAPRSKSKQLPKIDLTADLQEIEHDDQISKQVKLKKLFALLDKCGKQLNPQQLTYIKEYFIDFSVYKAGLRAGYSQEYSKGGGLMYYKAITDYILIKRKINEVQMSVTAEFVLTEFGKLAKVKASDLYDAEGGLIPPHLLPDWVSSAVSEVKHKTWQLDGKTFTEYTYKLHSKVAALDALGKHTGIYERDNKQKTPDYAQVVVYLPENGREQTNQDDGANSN